MPLTLERKKELLSEIEALLPQARSLFLVDFLGLTVAEITELRARVREAGGQFKVFKNTLARRAFEGTSYEKLNPYLEGPNALLLGLEDEVAPFKAVYEFLKEVEKGKVRIGVIGETLYEEKDLQVLAQLPSRQELLAQVVGGVTAPLYGLVWSLKGLLNQLVWTLSAVKEKKEKENAS